MSVILECIGCRDLKQFPTEEKYPVCEACEEWDQEHFKKLHFDDSDKPATKNLCTQCGYEGPAIDHHHIHGRKYSNETIVVCANCHREIHAGTRKII